MAVVESLYRLPDEALRSFPCRTNSPGRSLPFEVTVSPWTSRDVDCMLRFYTSYQDSARRLHSKGEKHTLLDGKYEPCNERLSVSMCLRAGASHNVQISLGPLCVSHKGQGQEGFAISRG